MLRSRSVFTLLGALAALATCSPDFRSGVTACAPTEPRCPEGYVCSGLRCYLPGNAPRDGGTLGGAPGADASGPGGDDGSAGGTGGAAGGGGAPAGGAGGSGGSPGTGGTGGGGGSAPPVGQAVIKFCNGLVNGDNSPFEAELVVGQIRLKALTETCSTAVGQACTGVPAGPVTMSLQRVAGGQVLATRQVTLQAGAEYVALANFDEMAGQAEIAGGPLNAMTKCASLGYDDLFVPSPNPDGGVPPVADAGPPPRDAAPLPRATRAPCLRATGARPATPLHHLRAAQPR